MENTGIISKNRRTFKAALFGATMLVFAGPALAATAPTVAPLKVEVTDANGNTYKIDMKITTGYEANRLAVDKNGNVYVTDAVMNTVSVFNTNGRLARQININRPLIIGVDDQNDRIYINGAFDGRIRSIYTFDKNGNGTGTLSQFAWGNPSGIAIGSSGDVYVADDDLNLVRRLSARGESEKKVFGPYGDEMNASEAVLNIKSGANDTVYRTRRRMVSFRGIAVDEVNGNLYVGAKGIMETLNDVCNTVSSGATGDSSTSSGSAYICYNDAGESYKYYRDLCPDGSCTGNKTTGEAYKYWNPMDGGTYPYTTKYHILIIDIKEKLSDGSDNPAYGTIKRDMIVADRGGGEWYVFAPMGLSLDGKGRLYVAGVGCDGSSTACSTAPGKIKVYDVDVDLTQTAPTLMTVSGFAYGFFADIVFSPDGKDGPPKGRFFAAMEGSNTLYSYSIDGGTNPANTAPAAPVLLEPAGANAVVKSLTPTLRIRNAADNENDPLTYSYEIYDLKTSAKIDSGANIGGGINGETSMPVTNPLTEDSLYRWRAQSFDGDTGTWSDYATFCVNENNLTPPIPGVIAPKGEVVSPFGSLLKWSASIDPDHCAGDTITYTVHISDSKGNIIKTESGLSGVSIGIDSISGLINGNTYTWKVMAEDNNGGKSDYDTGSFKYMTTVVRLDSDQPGTRVYMDGNYGYFGRLLNEKYDESGKLTVFLPVEPQDITPGTHFVTFVKPGYEPHYKIINVADPALDAAGSSVAYTAAMVAASRVKPPASGAELFKFTGGNAAPFIVDYNNDGLKDIISGGKVYVYNDIGEVVEIIDGKVYLYLSLEQAQADGSMRVVQTAQGALQADGSDIAIGSRAVPFVADYNNDGRKDLLIGSSDGKIYLYLNTGKDDVPVFASYGALKDSDGLDIKMISNSAPVVVDYNSDGKKDLVVGGSEGTLRLYVNTGEDAAPVFSATSVTISADGADLNAGSSPRVFFTDWNSDGKKDMVVGSTGGVNLYFNVGSDDSPVFLSISGLQKWIKDKKKERGNREYIKYLGYNRDLGDLTGGSGEASPFVVDWDGSSARDVIVGNGLGGVAAYITE